MFVWIAENIATIIICIILIGIVTAIIVNMIRNKKKGKLSCGQGCQGCSMRDSCHKH